ncbi:hypothetical protein SAMN04487934_103200 [Eubacterium ruminantium]|nr:hypothetical protein SAMN04487934_103200 [Eubacterium ruminantium]
MEGVAVAAEAAETNGFVNLYEFIHDFPLLYAVLAAVILPFLIIAVGYAINYIGLAIAFILSLFVDPWLVQAIINFLFFPGVILHELSHAFLAVITGAKVTEVALFKKEGESLGHVYFKNRGNRVIVSLQYIFISAAPMFCGALIVWGCWAWILILPKALLWLKILLGYIGASMFFHMTMSSADIKIYIRGIPIFMALLFIVTLALRLVGVL